VLGWGVGSVQREKFFAALNGMIEAPWDIWFFEEIVDLINAERGTPYWVVRGPLGIQDIRSAADGRLPEDVDRYVTRPSMPMFSLFVPDGFDAARARDRMSGASILGMRFGPALIRMGSDQMYANLSFATYPRMEHILASAVGYLSGGFGVPPRDLQAIVYGPGISLADSIALVRMGVGVWWREVVAQKRLQTEMELLRVPFSVRSQIRYLPQGTEKKAHLAVWTMPSSFVDIGKIGAELLRGGVALVNTENANHRSRISGGAFPEAWFISSHQFARGAMAFPTVFAPLSVGAPISFHAIRMMA
jgi:hypothetical protein